MVSRYIGVIEGRESVTENIYTNFNRSYRYLFLVDRSRSILSYSAVKKYNNNLLNPIKIRNPDCITKNTRRYETIS